MNVLFINTFYYPDVEERIRLERLQEKLGLSLIELAYQTKDLPSFQRALSKMRYHQGFKDRWLIYPGFKVDNKEDVG